ncbi:MAG TPA: site-2 protease family protein [Thermoguttaceae bacterium]|nr:site-2 protease family protein [Thermoguttaceae bacterium]
MKWSWKLGQVAGIGIFVHWTFVLLIAWLVYLFMSQGSDLRGVLDGVAFVLAIFGCIVLHELGHALMARRFGIQTRDITLLPIGGVARLERMPENPTQELWVALAGPAVNVLIAIVLFGVVVVSLGIAVFSNIEVLMKSLLVSGNFLLAVLVANVFLVIFNLVPAFPMDGGRVLRALLATKLDYVRATQIAASIGQTLAILFGILGFFGVPGLFGANPLWLFIALFVYLGADAEAHMVRVRSVMRGVPTLAAMVTRFRTVSPQEPLSSAIQELLAGHQQDFPVMEDDRIVGMLTRRDLLAAVAEGKHDLPIAEVMRRDFRVVDEAEMLDSTFQRMREGACSTLPVLREGRLVGIVTLENVGEWMMIQSALRKGGARGDVDDIYGVESTGAGAPPRLRPRQPPDPTPPQEPRP